MARLTVWFGWVLFFIYPLLAAEDASSRKATSAAEWLVHLDHSPQTPRPGEAVKITAETRPEVSKATLLYQVVLPGSYVELNDPAYAKNWVAVPMELRQQPDQKRVFVVELPGALQKNRCLVRYRLKCFDPAGKERLSPDPAAFPHNWAYFVYDGIPSWSGAIDPHSSKPDAAAPLKIPAAAMRKVQAYYLIGKRRSIENATWREQAWGKDYKYTGTLVVDDQVFDHVRYRARGGVWRYAMGKNMWKFALGATDLEARDDFGRRYPVPWNKINLRACIQQGDYGMRGEQGLFESVGFRLFNLAGVAAPFTHWVQLRIIDEPVENPNDQYRGDFWGLYLAIENEDGRFLKSHHLPSGNLFKMESGSGQLQHHAAGAVTNLSDLFGFMNSYRRPGLTENWWRENFDLTNYYSYRAICECIHHYDVSDGKNYDYYHNPQNGRWEILPWDIDLTWADHMFGTGNDPFKQRVLSRPAFKVEYQNRLREVRDLLFNAEQTGQIIDEYASVIWDKTGQPSIVEADRRKWDYHPAMAMSMKGGQGLFYRAVPERNFAGMIQLMKDYVRSRGAWIDTVLLNDPNVPATPKITMQGPAGFHANQLKFGIERYDGANDFAAVKWRLAEVAGAHAEQAIPIQAPREITAVWESNDFTSPSAQAAVPEGIAKSGHVYRARARVKDNTGRWSHWSEPVEFQAQ